MGDPTESGAPSPEKVEAYQQRLEELEALGVPTGALREILAKRPQDFERAADEALRRELQGDLTAGSPPSEPVPTGTTAPAPEGAPTRSEPSPTLPPFDTEPPAPAAAESAPASGSAELAELEAVVAAVVAEEPLRPSPPSPEPLVLESAEGSPAAVAASLDEELKQALAESGEGRAGAAESSAPPPLASGDSLSMGTAASPPVEAAPVAAADAAAKPPPPSALRPQAVAQRVVVRKMAVPPGAQPTPAGAASDVFPTEAAPRRRFGPAAASLLVLFGVFAATFLLLANGAPVASFTFGPAAPVAGQEVTFSANATTDPNNDPISYAWDFGDATNGSGLVARHTFRHSGNFTVILSASDNHKNTAKASKTVAVTAGSISSPPYRYGDRLLYDVVGTSKVEGFPQGTWLASVNYTLAGDFGASTCGITAVNLTYTGEQTRAVLLGAVDAQDGFLDPHGTFVLERSLPDLRLSGKINNTCPKSPIDYAGSAAVVERDFENLQNNDTVRAETTESAEVTVSDTDPPKTFRSTANLTDYPLLASAGSQLRLESIYAGRNFSTEEFASGAFVADGLNWSWLTQETEVVNGVLALKIHLVLTRPPTRISEFTIDLWVSSASSFPVKEIYYVRGTEIGKTYESRFTAVGKQATPGVTDIPYGDGSRNYATVAPSELAPLAQVPRSTAGANFNFTARTAYDEAIAQCPSFAPFVVDNPQAYAVNGTYSRITGNPRWALDFAQLGVPERPHVEDEHSTSAQVRCASGSVAASRSAAQLGAVVSLDYAAGLLAREATAGPLFPSGAFDSAQANFSVRQDLKLPGVSLNSASSAARAAIPYAFGVESFDTEPTRIQAFVDAQSGQLVFALAQTGDNLP